MARLKSEFFVAVVKLIISCSLAMASTSKARKLMFALEEENNAPSLDQNTATLYSFSPAVQQSINRAAVLHLPTMLLI
ncbi:hypothetical protein CIPAW_12G112900 [Carya illinoinensis]|uniref:Uncharacterized protein n=1 Tax=Carya illinoinensis TaxID=32201 RepID=A0A8T1NQJ6_CARIL|nr:hypothetical protein CIPAW_12G112900 [Carya illinoinensis]